MDNESGKTAVREPQAITSAEVGSLHDVLSGTMDVTLIGTIVCDDSTDVVTIGESSGATMSVSTLEFLIGNDGGDVIVTDTTDTTGKMITMPAVQWTGGDIGPVLGTAHAIVTDERHLIETPVGNQDPERWTLDDIRKRAMSPSDIADSLEQHAGMPLSAQQQGLLQGAGALQQFGYGTTPQRYDYGDQSVLQSRLHEQNDAALMDVALDAFMDRLTAATTAISDSASALLQASAGQAPQKEMDDLRSAVDALANMRPGDGLGFPAKPPAPPAFDPKALQSMLPGGTEHGSLHDAALSLYRAVEHSAPRQELDTLWQAIRRSAEHLGL